MARIFIDGVEYEAAEGENLLSVALALDLKLPYFCWHPALGSVGACRQCAVKQFRDSQDDRGKLVMACMVPVKDGGRFSIIDKEAAGFRAGVIEWLMLNHPHDCPVCDEGGECHLQDMTVMTGHVSRRARIPKRTFVNQDLGPFLTHEMNRCITCYRCVRFYQDYAGGSDLQAFASKNHVWFGRRADGPLESPFSGNLVEVCPTGVFTDKTLARHYTRKWDLQSAPTLCVHCGGGCNTLTAERYGTLRRVTNRYHREINGWFLCDRGRFGYEFVNGGDRVRQPLFRDDGHASLERQLAHLGERLRGMTLVGVGSPRASLEGNYALRRLVGAENFFSGLGRDEQALAVRALRAAREVRLWSLRETEECDAVLVLGEDVEATHPRLALSLRQAVRKGALGHATELGIPSWQEVSVQEATPGERNPLVVVSPLPTALDGVASHALRRRPDEIIGLVVALAAAVRGDDISGEGAEMGALLRRARRVAIVVGAVQGTVALIDAATDLFTALHGAQVEAGLVITAPEANTLGSALLEGRPLEDLPVGPDVACIVMENDLHRRLDGVEEGLGRIGRLMVIDTLQTRTTALAHAVLPCATFAEESGLYVNHEGRVQRSWQVMATAEPVRASWRWITLLGHALGRPLPWRTTPELLAALGAEFRELAAAVAEAHVVPPAWRIARQPHRYSGRTAMFADRTVFEPPPPRDPDSPFTFSMEGFGVPVPEGLAPRYWAPGWNSWQALNLCRHGPDAERGLEGVRLFPRPEGAPLARHVRRPAKPEGWIAVPLHLLFGAEELSARAPAVAERSPGPAVALHPDDAAALGFAAGEAIEIEREGRRWRAPLRLLPMARGVVAVTVGVDPFTAFPLYQTVQLRRAA
jgi:NADH-quinone oxidoreductase subunit G